MSQVLSDYNGMLVRDGSWDVQISKEVVCYRKLLVEGLTVLDIGGHIGCFAKHALDRGAKLVVSVEPSHENYELLIRNYQRLGWKWGLQFLAYEAAAVASCEPGATAILYLNAGGNCGTHTLLKTRGRRFAEVSTIDFRGLLQLYAPESVKIDIEGGEYELLQIPLPAHVKNLAVEYHVQRKPARDAARAAHADLLAQGFTTLREPNFDSKAWCALGIYSR